MLRPTYIKTMIFCIKEKSCISHSKIVNAAIKKIVTDNQIKFFILGLIVWTKIIVACTTNANEIIGPDIVKNS